MAIQTNDHPASDNRPDQPNNDTPPAGARTFTAGTGSTPMGSFDFMGLRGMIGLDRTDGSVEPYLQEVQKQIQRKLPDVKYERLQRLSNSYAFRYDSEDGNINFFGIQFVATSDPVSSQFVPASMRLRPMLEELKTRYSDQRVRLVDARIIIVEYQPEMERTFEMADTIVRTFNVTTNPDARNAQITSLVGTEFAADWSLHEARKLERALSPHGVPPRMDIALTLKAKIQHNLGRELKEFEVDYQPLGVIGGYVEFRAPELFTINGQTRRLWRPVFNITVLNSVIPLEGIGMILLAAMASTIYGTKYWANQWSNLQDGEPNPGFLEEDVDNRGKHYVLKNKEEMLEFLDAYVAAPEIAYQFQDGRDAIPGMWRMTNTDIQQKRTFLERVAAFFGVSSEELVNIDFSRQFDTRADGVFGQSSGTLTDSRFVDYLYIAAKNGFGAAMDPRIRQIMTVGTENTKDRAQVVADTTGTFTPLYFTSLAAINAGFIKAIVRLTEGRRLVIVDPSSQQDARTFGSFLAGFDSSQGLGSIVSNGITSRGLGLNSVWGF